MTKRRLLYTLLAGLASGCGDDDGGSALDSGAVRDAGLGDVQLPSDSNGVDGARAEASPADSAMDASADSTMDARTEAGKDASPEVPRDAQQIELKWGFADECFRNLPAAVGTRNIERKAVSSGNVRMAYVLETGDRLGTSGTMPWGLVAFAFAIDDSSQCITERQQLRYMGSHHNCADTAEATKMGLVWKLTTPDREKTRVTGDAFPISPLDFTRISCTTNAPGGQCRSGGPCQ